MAKVKRIRVNNLKAISELTADFDGCTAIITGRNNSGKTSFLRSVPDRIRGIKPDIIVKRKEEKGFAEYELTDGTKFIWKFDTKTKKGERLTYISRDNISMSVTREIAKKYFPPVFDIDKFLHSTSKTQIQVIQDLTGVDLASLDKKYKIAYDKRTEANTILRNFKNNPFKEPAKVEKPNLKEIEKQLTAIRTANTRLKNKWLKENDNHVLELQEFNKAQRLILTALKAETKVFDVLQQIKGKSKTFAGCINLELAKERLNQVKKPQKEKPITNLPEPKYESEAYLLQKLKTANKAMQDFATYQNDLKHYNDWKTEKGKATVQAQICDAEVKDIEKEKIALLSEAKLPEGFKIEDGQLLYNDFPMTKEQLSSSGIYIAALKLAVLQLGEVRTLHFDASFLDKISLSEIEKWADENDLQLLIERPDFEAGDITYHLIKD